MVMEPAPEAAAALNVVVAYEDFGTGKRAMHIYNRLAQEFQQDYRFKVDFWKFDSLVAPKLLKMAVAEAAAADVIFISAKASGELSLEVKKWIRRWLARNGNSSVTLVALLEGKDLLAIEGCATRAFLERLAGKAGINFHAHGFVTSKRRGNPPRSTGSEDDESQGFSLEQILRGPDPAQEQSTAE